MDGHRHNRATVAVHRGFLEDHPDPLLVRTRWQRRLGRTSITQSLEGRLGRFGRGVVSDRGRNNDRSGDGGEAVGFADCVEHNERGCGDVATIIARARCTGLTHREREGDERNENETKAIVGGDSSS